jgi:hypothetical protein
MLRQSIHAQPRLSGFVTHIQIARVCSGVNNRIVTTQSQAQPSQTSNEDEKRLIDEKNALLLQKLLLSRHTKELPKPPGPQKPVAKMEPVVGMFDHRFATQEQLEGMTAAHPLPAQRSNTFFNWLRHDAFSTYRRLYAIVLLANFTLFLLALQHTSSGFKGFTSAAAAIAVASNICLATLMRHEHCVNLLFRIFTSRVFRNAPLAIRRRAAKVYSYGGVHSGCGVSAFLWYIVFTVFLVRETRSDLVQAGDKSMAAALGIETHALLATSTIMLVLFLTIIVMSLPFIRSRYHNQWEWSHRFAGWTAVAIIWAQTILLMIRAARATEQPLGPVLASNPAFWLLFIVTLLFIYPWLRVRRRRVRAEKLSSHAVRLWFDSEKPLPTCVGTRLATNPLSENHGFATIPNPNDQPGFSVLVSHAGDWTRNTITNPPKYIWTRGAFTAGVLRVALLFRPVVIVATGSGIGPCLSFLQVHPNWPGRVLWSARDPTLTYGPDVLGSVFRADPRAVVINPRRMATSTGYRADLSALAFALYQEINAEAVVIISNPRATKELVGRLSRRGVPAYGAIFDS